MVMQESVDYAELNQLCKLIKKQCVICFFNFANMEGANIFPRINNLCQLLLNNALNDRARFFVLDGGKSLKGRDNTLSDMMVQDCFCHEWLCDKSIIDEAIDDACSSFWLFDKDEPEYYKEQKFLMSHKRVSLSRWKRGENPYAELQQLNSQYKQSQSNNKDITFVLKALYAIVEKNLSPAETEKAVREVFSNFPVRDCFL